jgi:adhesin transport system outer membrane protein
MFTSRLIILCCHCIVFALTSTVGYAQSLPMLIEEVLASHPSVRSQRALENSAKQAVEGAQWQFYPTPSVGFEQVDAGSTDPNYPSYGDKNVTTLRLQQPLWTGGRLTAGLDKAQAGVVVSQATLEGTRQDLALRVSQTYADWVGAYIKRRAYEKSLNAHRSLQAQIARRIAGGVSSRSDLTLLLGRQQQAEADLSAAQAQSQSALGRLAQLLGHPIQESLLASTLSAPQDLAPNLRDLLEQAQVEGPSVLKLKAQARIAEAEIVERQADMLPEAYLRAERQYGNYSYPNSAPINRYFVGFSSHFGAGLSSLTQVSGAQARYEAAMADVDSARIGLAEQIQADYAQAQAGQSRLIALAASLESSDDIARAWNRQFIAGRKTWQDVMNAVREQAQLEAQIADVKASQLLLSWRLAIIGRGVDRAMAQGQKQSTELSMDGRPSLVLAMESVPEIPLYAQNESEAITLQMAFQIDPLNLGVGIGATNTSVISKNSEATW